MEDTVSNPLTEVKSKPCRRNQYLMTFSATLSGLSLGIVVSYTSPAGPRMKDPTNPADGALRLTEFQLSWFSSSVTLSGALGALLCGYCMDRLGRRMSFFLITVVMAVGWVVIATGPNFAVLMVGRLLTGIALGAAPVVAPAYIGEIASPEIRGTLAGCFPVMAAVGNMWGYVFGTFITSWRWLAGVCAAPTVLALILIPFTRESPLYLLMKNKQQKARDTLQYFRGEDQDISDEFEKLHQFLEETKSNRGSLRDLLLPYNLKPFAICLMVLFFDQFSGVTPVYFNLLAIFQEAACGISGDLSTMVIGIVQLIIITFSASVVDRLGRKTLLIVSSAVMVIALAGLGDYFYFKDQNSEWAKETLGWLPLTSLVVYVAAINLGFFPIQWILLGELLTPEVKGIAGSISIMMSNLFGFVISLTFSPMQKALGIYGTYWFYAAMCVLALIFCVAFVPETKGKTMQEIASYFGNPAAHIFVSPAEGRGVVGSPGVSNASSYPGNNNNNVLPVNSDCERSGMKKCDESSTGEVQKI